MAISEGKVRKSITFPIELYDRALEQAAKEYRSISGLICFAVERYLEEKEAGK